MSGNSSSKKIGLIAGWGRFPILVAKALKRQGYQVVCVGIIGHADAELANICDETRFLGLGKMGAQIRFLRRRGCLDAVMAGKIFKSRLFVRFGMVRQLPDLSAIHCFLPILTKSKDRCDDTLLTLATEYWQRRGIRFAPATDFAPELLVPEGNLTKKSPTASELKDIRFGWKVAKEMGRLDIGQSVVVKDRAVLAVEAIEGTDECIKRGGCLCKAGGFTVVKVAKPDQDMRFDVPTIGVGTIETIHKHGGKILAIEAGKTIILDEQQTVATANRLGVIIVALSGAVQAHVAA